MLQTNWIELLFVLFAEKNAQNKKNIKTEFDSTTEKRLF